jgi:hypothetical protein
MVDSWIWILTEDGRTGCMEKFVKTALLIGTRTLVINKNLGFSLFKTT